MLQLSNIPVAQTYSQILEFFQDRSRFAQGYYNFDKDGKHCPWKEGYSFCVLGAICFFTDGMSHKAQCLLQRVSEYMYEGKHIQEVNDGEFGYEYVTAALQFARDLWEGQEPTEEELGMSVKDLLDKRGLEPSWIKPGWRQKK